MILQIEEVIVNEFPKPFKITKWLCISSCFLCVPGVYGFYHRLYLYGTVSTYTSILSINHWRDAKDGRRRLMDRISASSCFCLYFVSGSLYCQGICFYGYAIPILGMILSSFFTSNYLSIRWHPHWVYSHIIFHLLSSLSQLLVIYCILLSYNS